MRRHRSIRPRSRGRTLPRLMLLFAVALALCLLPAMAWADGAPFTVRPLATAVVAGFDGPPAPWLPGHRGVDFAASQGTPVRAPADGTVNFAGTVVDRPVVTLRHSPLGAREMLSSFEPVIPAVRIGATVRAGQVIGWVGSGGHCDTGCVHWGLRVGDDYVDPLGLLAASVRLLPLDARSVPLPIAWPAPVTPAHDAGHPAPRHQPVPIDVLVRAVLSVV